MNYERTLHAEGTRCDSFVLCVGPNHADQAIRTCRHLRRLHPHSRLSVLTSKSLLGHFEHEDVTIEDEDLLLPGLSLGNVARQLKARGLPVTRAGWYFQQFLKMAFALKTDSEAYVLWDADTLPLQPVRCEQNGQSILLCHAYSPDPRYRRVFESLLPGRSWQEKSFICERMRVKTEDMRRLIGEVEASAPGRTASFWERVLECVRHEDVDAGFSEYQTYASFVLSERSKAYCVAKVRHLRTGRFCVGDVPAINVLTWLSRSFETVSFETWDTTGIPAWFSKWGLYRSLVPAWLHVKSSGAIRRRLRGSRVISSSVSKENSDRRSIT